MSQKKVLKILEGKLQKIRLIVFDVDGVLTDGRIYLLGESEELKAFSNRDAPRTAVALRSGLKVIWLTARKSAAVERRARELGVTLIYKHDLKSRKLPFLEIMHKRFGVRPNEILYVGDDWSDLHLMKQVGLAVTPSNGSSENKKVAHIITNAPGGDGVAAEIIELVMRAQGTWSRYVGKYLAELIY
ncbi:MAG: HAD-IIIA family hydrolase [bacterium]|nr:HAD-IIIA family hydrolase [bacterium]